MAGALLGDRFPVLRRGEREAIDPYKRRLIYARDGYACKHCGRQVEPDCPAPGAVLQLDHIIPWSALGSDRSDNLRSLCARCNEVRSNFVDLWEPRVVGVTQSCYWCAARNRELPEWVECVPVEELDRIRAYCGRCGTTSWVPAENWIL